MDRTPDRTIPLKQAGAATGHYLNLKNDGDRATFYVPRGSSIVERKLVWKDKVSRAPLATDKPEDVQLKYSVEVVTGDGITKTLEASPALFKRWLAAVERDGGDEYSWIYTIERIGAAGDKKTVYRFAKVGPVPAPIATSAAPAHLVDGLTDEEFLATVAAGTARAA
jgi:hypothetical protein